MPGKFRVLLVRYSLVDLRLVMLKVVGPDLIAVFCGFRYAIGHVGYKLNRISNNLAIIYSNDLIINQEEVNPEKPGTSMSQNQNGEQAPLQPTPPPRVKNHN